MPFSFKPTEASITGEQSQGSSVVGMSAPLSQTPPSLASQSSDKTMSLSARFSTEGRGILEIILFAVLAFAIFVTVVLFGYSFYLKGQIESKKQKISALEQESKTLPLADMQALSNRMRVVSTLVREHPSVRSAFRILEESIENPVVYTSFGLNYSESARSYELTVAAKAPDYHSVVNQMDTFKRKPFSTYIPNVTISGLRPDVTGKITFNLKMPIAIIGVLPESLNLQDSTALISPIGGVSTQMASSTETGTSTP